MTQVTCTYCDNLAVGYHWAECEVELTFYGARYEEYKDYRCAVCREVGEEFYSITTNEEIG